MQSFPRHGKYSRFSFAALIVAACCSGCATLQSWKPATDAKPKKVAAEKTPGLFDSKPNTRQAQIDLAIVAAEQHEAKHEYREAMKKYQEILELDKKSALAHHRIALTACRLSASKQAQEHFESAIKLAPKDPELIADYAYWHYLNGQYPQASSLVDDGIKRHPDFERLHGIRGLLLARDHQFESAAQSFVQSGCSTQQAWANIGHVLLLEGDVQSASYWIDHAAQGDQGSETAKRTQSVLQASYNAPATPDTSSR